MADERISELDELTDPATGDELVAVDKSDTSMAPSGTNKRLTVGTLDGRYATDADLTAGLALKQDASSAATDVELAAEASTRAAADTALDGRVDALEAVDNATQAELDAALALKQDASTAATDAELSAHTGRTDNPHSVTKAQVGLGSVDNTSDAGKPVSTAQQAALDLKQNAATAATDTELAAEATTRADADTALDGRVDALEAVDNATQAELDAHKTSADHDGRYYTELETDALLDAKEDSLAGATDNVTARILVIPDDSTDQNGVVVKCPSVNWGDPDVDTYGKGQAFMVLREGAGDATDLTPASDSTVLFRVDRRGGVGVNGGAHFATGLRWRPEDANPTYSIHINPSIDCIGIIGQLAPAGTQDFFNFSTSDSVVKARLASDGTAIFGGVGDAGGQVQLGSAFSVPSILLGTSGDCYLHRSATGTLMLNPTTAVKISDAYVEYDEVPAPGNPPADGARLWVEDNGSGKTRLCVKFATGSAIVLATQA